jgi:hypothetical protein
MLGNREGVISGICSLSAWCKRGTNDNSYGMLLTKGDAMRYKLVVPIGEN